MFRVLLVILAIIVLLLGAQHAGAHGWYDQDCCSDRDCDVATDVVYVPGGRLISSRVGTAFIPNGFSKIRPSQDEFLHVCMTLYADVRAEDVAPGRLLHRPYCVYEPAGS